MQRLIQHGKRLVPAPARTRIRRALESSPRLYCAVGPRLYPNGVWIRPATDILIDGYPSSANTFARKAMERSNPGVVVASHVHRWAHVVRGVQRGLPVVVLLRDPRDAIASRLVRLRPDVSMDDAITDYTGFYQGVERVAGRVVIAPFEVVTSRFGDVISAVNRRFETSFQPFLHSSTTEAEVFREMDREGDTKEWRWKIAHPSQERASQTAKLRDRLASEFAFGMAACDTIYEELLSSARRDFPLDGAGSGRPATWADN